MINQSKIFAFPFLALSLIAFLGIVPVWTSAGMTSTSFKIDSDVVGSWGAPSDADNFKLNDTGGEMGTGLSDSSSFNLGAGFWNMATDYSISINCDATVTMGSITGTGQSTLGTNSANCNIDTDNPAGYSLFWRASADDMTSGGDSIAAYTPTSAGVPETWSVASADSEWGGHLGSTSTTVDTGAWGTLDTYAGGKWLNVLTTDTQVASRGSRTTGNGDDELLWFGAEIGSNKLQSSGSYSVTVTITALTL